MENQEAILAEVREIKSTLAMLIGTNNLDMKQPFSIEAIEKAAKSFQKLSIERGLWVEEYDISKIIKNAPYRAGKLLREELHFKNYFKRGQQYYFYKPDLIALAAELKSRNINLERYKELKESETSYAKYWEPVMKNPSFGKGKPFKLPKGVKNIEEKEVLLPPLENVKAEIKKLKEEFFEEKLDQYIDIIRNNHALGKNSFYLDRYGDKRIMRRVRKWCDDFNTAHAALRLITKKTPDEFIPMRDEDMIEL